MDEHLTLLLADLRERFGSGTDRRELEAYLSSKGYDVRQIGEILAHLRGDVSSPPLVARAVGVTFRVQGPHERGRFAPEAWGHLLGLGSAGVLTPPELEHLIERALMQLDGRIALDDLRTLLEGSGLDEGPASVTVH
jgi:Smg protein